MIKSIHSNSSKDATFTFAPSVQSDLFGYLKPEQREALRPYLRIVKRPYQEKLCISLLDFLEGHDLEPLNEPILRQLQAHIIVACELHPLTGSKFNVQGFRSASEPKSLGAIIKQLFPCFSNR